MRKLFRSFSIAVLLGFFTVASAQLPPKIVADKHLIYAEQLYAAKDYAAAFEVMEKVIALQQEHSLTLSDEFHFKYAQISLAADSTRIALESVTRYLSATGDEGEFYKEALALMLKAEGNEVMTAEDFYNDVIKAQGTCKGLPRGSECWMELTNHLDCYIWIDFLWEGESATWTGKCSGNLPEGKGVLTTSITKKERDNTQTYKIEKFTGSLHKGKKHDGELVSLSKEASLTSEGSYVDGLMHGHWVQKEYHLGGTLHSKQEGAYIEGRKHGKWVIWLPVTVTEGSYVDDLKHGHWVEVRLDYGCLAADDLKHGHWAEVRPDCGGRVTEGPYVDDLKHGHWIIKYKYGEKARGTTEGLYVAGKRHGNWVARDFTNGVISEGQYLSDSSRKRHGNWVLRHPDGTVGGGLYVKDKKHGVWIEISIKGKGRYVNGKKEGTWLVYQYGDCRHVTYENDKKLDLRKKVKKELCREAGLIPEKR